MNNFARNNPSRSDSTGFTLVELVVAAGITTLLATLMIAVVGNVSGFWSRIDSRLRCESQAGHILDQFFQDISAAHFREDGNTWLAADMLDDAWANVALRFFTTKRGNTLGPTTSSTPVAVGYKIIRQSDEPPRGRVRYTLCRVEVRPGQSGDSSGTFESGYDITAAAYGSGSADGNEPGAIQMTAALATDDWVFGENVIAFEIRCYRRDPTQPGGLSLFFPQPGEPSGSPPLRARRWPPSGSEVDE